MLRNKDILDEKNKLLRQTSKEVTFPMEQDDLVAIDKMIEYLKNSQIEEIAEKYNLRPGMGMADVKFGILKRFFTVVYEKDDGEFDVYVSSLTTAPTGDPEYFFNSTVVTGAAKNYGKYSNQELDEVIDKMHHTFDQEERSSLAVEAQQMILDDSSYFFVSHLNMGIVTKSNVTGIAAHPCDYYEITADLDVQS